MNDQDVAITISARDEASKKLQDVRKNVDSLGDTGSEIKEKLQKASVAIAAIGVGLTAYSKSAVDSTVDYVRGVNTLSRQTGMAVDTTSRLVYALGRSGVSAQEASASLGVFSKQIAAANDKNGEAAQKQAEYQLKIDQTKRKIAELTEEQRKNGDKTGEIALKLRALNMDLGEYSAKLNEASSPLAKLGIATQEADGRTRAFDQILLDVADKFEKMPNGAEKTALAMQLFGRSGKDLIPVLNQGRDGLAEMAAQADKLGLTLTPENVARVSAYIKAQKELKDSQQALSMAVGMEAIPMWQKLTEATNSAVSSVLKLPEPLDKAAVAVLAFGGPVATAIAGIAGFGANMGQLMSSFPVVGKALGALASSFGSLGSLLLGWPGLILLVIAGVVLLLNHFGVLKPMIDTVTNAFRMVWQELMVALQPAIAAIQVAFQQLSPYFPIIAEAAKIVAMVIGAVLVGALITLMHIISAVIQVVAGFVAFFVQRISYMVQAGAALIEFFKALFTGNFDALPGIAWRGIQAVLGAIFNFRGALSIIQGVMGGIITIIQGGINGAIGAVRAFVGGFSSAGAALIDAFANGVRGAFDKAKNVVKDGMNAVRRLLPFSDAKEGPLSDLTLSGQRFSETIAAGIRRGTPAMVRAAHEGMAALDMPAVSPVISPAFGAGSSGTAGETVAPSGTRIGVLNIYPQTAEASAEIFRQLDNDTILANKGLTPIRGGAL